MNTYLYSVGLCAANMKQICVMNPKMSSKGDACLLTALLGSHSSGTVHFCQLHSCGWQSSTRWCGFQHFHPPFPHPISNPKRLHFRAEGSTHSHHHHHHHRHVHPANKAKPTWTFVFWSPFSHLFNEIKPFLTPGWFEIVWILFFYYFTPTDDWNWS